MPVTKTVANPILTKTTHERLFEEIKSFVDANKTATTAQYQRLLRELLHLQKTTKLTATARRKLVLEFSKVTARYLNSESRSLFGAGHSQTFTIMHCAGMIEFQMAAVPTTL